MGAMSSTSDDPASFVRVVLGTLRYETGYLLALEEGVLELEVLLIKGRSTETFSRKREKERSEEGVADSTAYEYEYGQGEHRS